MKLFGLLVFFFNEYCVDLHYLLLTYIISVYITLNSLLHLRDWYYILSLMVYLHFVLLLVAAVVVMVVVNINKNTSRY